ncbi:head-tail connector protein [Roseobacter sp. YSTF-M11]|uniref:Head-tail connector protein n=1 Tax=Roseobacter insulae TaxID=2859783 RepID=A0A9X1K4L5_9RHOB|nr:portal protein [Roseobacter insulae]MBW4710728.1 head-tail connector protein [Roseobacter insulae]
MKTAAILEKEPRAQAAIRRWGELKSERGRHEQDWEDIARLIRPQRGGFKRSDPTTRVHEKPLSSEPIMAASAFASGIYAGITNPANRWAGLQTPDPDLNNWQPMAEWNDIVTRRVLNSFAPSVASFYPSTFQAYSDISAFGQAAGYDEMDDLDRKFVDVTMSLAEVVVSIDAHGRVVEAVRKYRLSGAMAIGIFKPEMLPVKLVEMAQKGDHTKVVFYTHILKNTDFRTGRIGPGGKRWLSHTACEMEETLVRVKGYNDMPVYFPRWDVDSGHTYGTGPGFIALASARTNDLMERATLKAAQFAADPPWLAPDREVLPLNGRMRPGEVVYGGTTINGQEVLKRAQTNTSIGLTIDEKRAKVEAIKEAFHYTLMSLNGRTGITNDEVRIMEEAKLRNWAPHADRIMEEYGARKVERRFKLLWRAGQLPPPPEGLPPGMGLQVKYQSAATMAMQASEGIAIRAFIADLNPLMQLNPRYADRIDPDALIESLHDATASLPAKMLRSRDEADAMAQARAERQQQAEQLAQLEAGAGIAKDAAAAGVDMAQVLP